MVTNKQVQDEFHRFLDGEAIEWQLLKIFFHQNGGFSRKDANEEGEIDGAVGMTISDSDIVVSFMDLYKEDGDFMAEEVATRRFKVDNHLEARIPAMIQQASGIGGLAKGLDQGSDESDDKEADLDYVS